MTSSYVVNESSSDRKKVVPSKKADDHSIALSSSWDMSKVHAGPWAILQLSMSAMMKTLMEMMNAWTLQSQMQAQEQAKASNASCDAQIASAGRTATLAEQEAITSGVLGCAEGAIAIRTEMGNSGVNAQLKTHTDQEATFHEHEKLLTTHLTPESATTDSLAKKNNSKLQVSQNGEVRRGQNESDTDFDNRKAAHKKMATWKDGHDLENIDKDTIQKYANEADTKQILSHVKTRKGEELQKISHLTGEADRTSNRNRQVFTITQSMANAIKSWFNMEQQQEKGKNDATATAENTVAAIAATARDHASQQAGSLQQQIYSLIAALESGARGASSGG